MSLLSLEHLISSLQLLSPTQDHMQILSLYITTNQKDSQKIIETWKSEFHKSNAYHKLTLLYLANEILQTSKGDVVSLLRECVPACFLCAVKDAESMKAVGLSKRLGELAMVWVQRSLFDAGDLNVKKEDEKGAFRREDEIKGAFGREDKKGAFRREDEKGAFGREEVLMKINNYFDTKEGLIMYLEKFIEILKKDK